MRILKNIFSLVKVCDFFKSSDLLRYDRDNEYKTITGGIFSIGIIITIIIGFASMIIDTLNRSSITYTLDTINNMDPTLTTIVTSPQNKFMYGISIQDLNLSSSKRYFDVLGFVYKAQNNNMSGTYFPMQQCTKEHWAGTPDVANRFDRLGASAWLCPPIGSSFDMFGERASQVSQWLSFIVVKCNNASNPLRPCASQSEIDTFISDKKDAISFTFFHIKSVINPSQPNFVKHSLQDRKMIYFGTQIGIFSMVYITDYTMNTDNSIWPFTNIQTSQGFFIEDTMLNNPYRVNGKPYVTFSVVKSSKSQIYDREVQKISSVFSFIGGLIGAIMAVMFLLGSYTHFSYQVSIAMQIFKVNDFKKQKNVDLTVKANLLNFIKHWIFQISKKFEKPLKWPHIEYMYDCRRQILHQLDIKSLVKRIGFLQYCMSNTLEQYHIQGLQLNMPTSPYDTKKLRLKMEKQRNQYQLSLDDQQQSQISESAVSMVLNKKTMQQNKKLFIFGKFSNHSQKLEPICVSFVKDKLNVENHIGESMSKVEVVQSVQSIREDSNYGLIVKRQILQNNKQLEIGSEEMPKQIIQIQMDNKQLERERREKRAQRKKQKNIRALKAAAEEGDVLSKKIISEMQKDRKYGQNLQVPVEWLSK